MGGPNSGRSWPADSAAGFFKSPRGIGHATGLLLSSIEFRDHGIASRNSIRIITLDQYSRAKTMGLELDARLSNAFVDPMTDRGGGDLAAQYIFGDFSHGEYVGEVDHAIPLEADEKPIVSGYVVGPEPD
jgi:hypothetical protein